MAQGNAYRRGCKEEKRQAKAALVPMLQAEEDRRCVCHPYWWHR